MTFSSLALAFDVMAVVESTTTTTTTTTPYNYYCYSLALAEYVMLLSLVWP